MKSPTRKFRAHWSKRHLHGPGIVTLIVMGPDVELHVNGHSKKDALWRAKQVLRKGRVNLAAGRRRWDDGPKGWPKSWGMK